MIATSRHGMFTHRSSCAAAVLAVSALAAGLGRRARPGRVRCETVLRPLATFDDYANGSLRGQGPWS